MAKSYDPECLLTGAEAAAGMTYINSERVWPDAKTRQRAARGELTHDEIALLAPRQLCSPASPPGLHTRRVHPPGRKVRRRSRHAISALVYDRQRRPE